MLTSRRTLGILLATATLVACGASGASPESSSEHVGSSSAALIYGDASDSSQDFAVRITISNGTTCSGTLISPTFVLTAQHCFTDSGTLEGSASENSVVNCTLGTSPAAASEISITTGPTLAGPPIAVNRVFFDVDNDKCYNDIVILELATPVTGVTFHPLVLDVPVPINTPMYEVAWGDVLTSDSGTYVEASVRAQASGTTLLDDGAQGTVTTPYDLTVNVDGPGFITTSVSSCNGDSGGGEFSLPGSFGGTANGAQIAVVGGLLAGGNAVAIVQGASQSDCKKGITYGSPLNSDHNRSFIEQAYQTNGMMPWRTPQPQPPGDIGTACTFNYDCNSNYCVKLNDVGSCSKTCTLDDPTTCPTGTQCVDTGVVSGDSGTATSVCIAPQPKAGERGCEVAGGKDDRGPEAALGAGLALLAVMCGRRKRNGASGERTFARPS